MLSDRRRVCRIQWAINAVPRVHETAAKFEGSTRPVDNGTSQTAVQSILLRKETLTINAYVLYHDMVIKAFISNISKQHIISMMYTNIYWILYYPLQNTILIVISFIRIFARNNHCIKCKMLSIHINIILIFHGVQMLRISTKEKIFFFRKNIIMWWI